MTMVHLPTSSGYVHEYARNKPLLAALSDASKRKAAFTDQP
jgi:hypothetical protein